MVLFSTPFPIYRNLAYVAFTAFVCLASSASHAADYDLRIDENQLYVDGKKSRTLSINRSIPGPTLRLKEGEDVTINVHNDLDEDASIHWHGLILPYREDGVPGLSYGGIPPGKTFTYHFPVKQSGTYWYHSHSGQQEQAGVYGALLIEPKTKEPFEYDREYVIMFSDWFDTDPKSIFAKLKAQPEHYGFYERDKLTVWDFLDDNAKKGLWTNTRQHMQWGKMRMSRDDIADVSGYTFLINGKSARENWTALFRPSEKIRLRMINASSMTPFDVQIPGLKMTVVQTDGNNVQPVEVDAMRIAVAETYDVIVTPKDDRAYTLFAESVSRSGYARATLAPRIGMSGTIPPTSKSPRLTMSDMPGHSPAQGQGKGHGPGDGTGDETGHEMNSHENTMPASTKPHHAAGRHAPYRDSSDPFYAPGSGLTPHARDGGKFLSYADLKAIRPRYPHRKPDYEVEVRLTGNMYRYIWSINGKKYSEQPELPLILGKRVRLKFINQTMMMHPMHLHGLWMILDNGNGHLNPAKNVLNIPPNTVIMADVEVDAPGQWAFHCHLLYHMSAGMFRKVVILDEEGHPTTQSGYGRVEPTSSPRIEPTSSQSQSDVKSQSDVNAQPDSAHHLPGHSH